MDSSCARRGGGPAWTQLQLAGRVGLTQPTVARIESGQAGAGFEQIVQLVRATGFDLEIHVVPLDEDGLALAEQNLRRTPDERFDTLLAAAELADAGPPAPRRSGEGEG